MTNIRHFLFLKRQVIYPYPSRQAIYAINFKRYGSITSFPYAS